MAFRSRRRETMHAFHRHPAEPLFDGQCPFPPYDMLVAIPRGQVAVAARHAEWNALKLVLTAEWAHVHALPDPFGLCTIATVSWRMILRRNLLSDRLTISCLIRLTKKRSSPKVGNLPWPIAAIIAGYDQSCCCRAMLAPLSLTMALYVTISLSSPFVRSLEI